MGNCLAGGITSIPPKQSTSVFTLCMNKKNRSAELEPGSTYQGLGIWSQVLQLGLDRGCRGYMLTPFRDCLILRQPLLAIFLDLQRLHLSPIQPGHHLQREEVSGRRAPLSLPDTIPEHSFAFCPYRKAFYVVVHTGQWRRMLWLSWNQILRQPIL